MDNFFVELFQKLTPGKEVKAFGTHLKHSGKTRLLTLYNYLRKMHPNFEDRTKLDPAYIFERLYSSGKEKTTDNPRKFILNQLSDLHKELNNFLVTAKLQDSPYLYQLLQLEVLKERDLKTRFFRKIDAMEADLYKDAQPNHWQDLIKVKIHEERLAHSRFRNTAERAGELKKFMDALTNFSLAAGYNFGTALIGHKTILGEASREHILFNSTLARNIVTQQYANPLVKALALAYLVQAAPSADTYQDLKQFLLQNPLSRRLAMSDQFELLTVLVNYCAAQIKEQDIRYLHEAFELNRFGLQAGIFLYEGYLAENKFLNIVSTACRLQEFEWVRTFIDAYRDSLLQPVRYPALQIAYATIGLYEEYPRGVIYILNATSFDHPFHSLRAKMLCMLAKYDLEKEGFDGHEVEVLRDCRNLSYFLKHNAIIKGNNKRSTENLVRMVSILARGNQRKASIQATFDEVQSTIFYPDWVQKRIDEYLY